MKTELPNFWAIKAKNHDEAIIIQPYANKMAVGSGHSKWVVNDCKKYYVQIMNGEYYDGNLHKNSQAEEITIEEFKTLVLGENIEPTYEIY